MTRFPENIDFPSDPQTSFTGFQAGALEVLSKLHQLPTVAQYRELKSDFDNMVAGPFKSFRDDLVVNWVLPNALPLETERNVFSRIPKNDFGAGGANSHLWMSFYRIGTSRLGDVQLVHSLSPEGFAVGLYVSRRMTSSWEALSALLSDRREEILHVILQIVRDRRFELDVGSGALSASKHISYDQLDTYINYRPRHFWLKTSIPAREVLTLGPDLLSRSLSMLCDLWPAYHMIVQADEQREMMTSLPGSILDH